MRDFNQWLGDLTESLQEKEAPESDPAEIHGMWARPEPCDVCGSAEEVCECEEDDERCSDQEFHDYVQHISQNALAYGTKLHENFEKDLREGLLAPLPDVKQAVFQYSIGSHTAENVTKPWDDCTVDEEELRKIGQDLHREILDAQLARMRQCLQVPQEYMRETHAKTATEVMECQRAASLRIRQADHELQAYTQRFVRDMLRRAEREGDDE